MSFLVIIGLALGLQTTQQTQTTKSRTLLPAVAALNDTGLKLLASEWKRSQTSVVVSPFSAQLCLTACLLGADQGTAVGLAKALNLGSLPPLQAAGEYRRLLATFSSDAVTHRSALWVRNQAAPGVVAALRDSFATDLLQLADTPGSILQQANRWAEMATRGRIKKALEKVTPGTTFLVGSTCTFDAAWGNKPLLMSGEQGLLFTPLDGAPYRVNALKWSGTVRYLATESFSAALIPYEGERFGLLVLLPVPSKSIAELLSELSSDSLLSQVLARKPRTFRVTLPKFTLTSRVDMASFLKLQGAVRAFEAGNRFPAFARNASLSQVVQTTMIQVDEKGTRAAAATFAGGGGLGGATELRADRPFIFMVVDTSLGTVLFAGVCANP